MDDKGMHAIQPARLKPGVTRQSVATPTTAGDTGQASSIISGKALIVWDLKVPGKKRKLDAIDTDRF
jgi:hypothetical protein